MEEFTGGTTTVVRIGSTVRRPVRPWSAAVRWLLDRLAAAQVRGVPRHHGVDEQGREVLDFLPGEVGADWQRDGGDPALVTAAELLRRVHDATADLPDKTAHSWWLPTVEPVEVLCHGDFAPYNCVFDQGVTTGVFDFDAAHPGPRSWDLAYAVYRFAPMSTVDSPAPEEQARRARLFLDSYGRTRRERLDVVAALGPRLLALVALMRGEAAAGNPAFARHIADGHADLYLADVEHIAAHHRAWARVVVG